MDDAVVFEVAAFISGGGRAVDAWQELVVVVVGIEIRRTFC